MSETFIKKSESYLSGALIAAAIFFSLPPVLVLAAPVASISLTPQTAIITVGSTQQFSAIAYDSTGMNQISPQPTFTWSSSDTAVATIDATGLVTAVSVGSVTITASSGGINGTATLTVNPSGGATFNNISISSAGGPFGGNITVGTVTQLQATAWAPFGMNPISPQPTFTWSSSDTAVATVSATGLFTAVAPGPVTITASALGVNGSVSVNVVSATPPSPNIISLTTASGPIGGNIAAGLTKQFVATVWDSTGMNQISPQPTFTWSSSDTAVATVSATGLFTAVAPGPVTITASSGGISGSVSLTVISATPTITTVSVSLTSSLINVGSTSQLSATALDQFGAALNPQPTFTWSSSDTAVATIDATGLVTAVSVGSVTITASSGGINGTATISVVLSGASTLTTINITQFPINNTLQVGQSWGLSAVALDQNGASFFPPPTITWSSSNTAVATISATPNAQGVYVLTAKGVGSATITASSAGISGTAILTVNPVPPRIASISISPALASINVGATQQFIFTALDQYGAVMNPAPAVVWLSGAPAIATVDNNGLATALSPGQTQITVFVTTNITASANLTITPIPGTFGITSSAGANGAISPLGYTSVVSGASQAYSITPNANFNVADVLVDGVSVGAVTTYTFNNVTANHTISATFAINTNGVTASAGAGGTISPSGGVVVAFGGNQSFTITPNANYHIADVLVDGVSVGAVSTYLFLNITTPHTISATFAINTNNIISSAGANGSITPLGVTAVNYGSNQTYAITANAGYQVADIQVDGVSVGAAASYTFINVTASHTINATFAPLGSATITASAGAGGTISPSGSVVVASGASQSFTITPNTGYSVADVLIDGISTGAVASYTFTNVTANHTIAASFIVNAGGINITASAGAGGAISPPGITAVISGTSQAYVITPNLGYSISDVLVDGVSIGAIANYTFTNITTSHTISAVFAINTFNITSSAGANGSITPLGVTAVNYGASQTYTITPNANYSVASVLVDGVSVGAVTTYTFNNVTAAHTISVSFLLPTAIINLNTGWNLIALPLQSLDITTGLPISYTAETFGVLASADVMAQWVTSSQSFSSHIVGLPVNNFAITAGMGFFVHVIAPQTLTFSGPLFTQTPPVISAGWNLVGYNNNIPGTAETFVAGLTGVDSVAKYNSAGQTYSSHIVGLPVNNFTINQGEGVFIHHP